MSLSFLFFLLLGYILYRFVVGFVLPVARTARGMKKQFEQMKQQGYSPNENSGAANHSTSYNETPSAHSRTTSGRKGAKEDYIEFEDVPAPKR